MPVIGYNTVGGSSALITKWWSCKFTAPNEAGTITDLNYYGNALGPGINFKLCIWADSSGSPGTLLAESTSSTFNTTTQWWPRPISYAFSPNEVLHFGIVLDDWCDVYRDAGGTNQFTEFTEDFTNWPTAPDPPTVDGQYNLVNSIYANYTQVSRELYMRGIRPAPFAPGNAQ